MSRLCVMLICVAQLGIANSAAAGDAVTGKAIAQRGCVSCHLIEGGTSGDAAPPFAALARDPSLTPDHLAAFLTRPHGGMDGMTFTRQEIDDLLAYIDALRPRP